MFQITIVSAEGKTEEGNFSGATGIVVFAKDVKTAKKKAKKIYPGNYYFVRQIVEIDEKRESRTQQMIEAMNKIVNQCE